MLQQEAGGGSLKRKPNRGPPGKWQLLPAEGGTFAPFLSFKNCRRRPRGAERVLGHRVGGAEPAEQQVIDPAVHMHQADIIQLLMAGETARGLAGQTPDRVVLERDEITSAHILHF
jgi:hypothetical protein